TDPGNNQPHIPGVTDFPVSVDLTGTKNFNLLSDLDVKVNLIHPNLDQLSIVLKAPAGSGLPDVTLVQNQTDAANNSNKNVGISGANLGQAPVGQFLGTIF